MTGKELLKQYNSLIKEIKELERDIKRLEKLEPKHEIDSVKGSNPHFPYQERNFKISGYNILEEEKIDNRLARKEDILLRRKCKCEDIKLQIEDFISNIPDSLTRRVFQYRYIGGLEWLQVSRKLGKYDESYSRKIHDRYMERLE